MIQFPNTDARQIQTNIFGFGKAHRVQKDGALVATGILENVTLDHVVLNNAVVGKEFFKKYIFKNAEELEFLEISDEDYRELIENINDLSKKKTKAK